MLRLEVDAPAVDPDVSLRAVILSISLRIRFASLFFVHAVVSPLVSPVSVSGAPSFSRCDSLSQSLLYFQQTR
jgi:hypothetical protein